MTSPKSHYNKDLKDYSQDLRSESTKGEIILWKKVLRAKMKFDFQFNRQYPMSLNGKGIIVDFICRKLKLIIEVDGYSHKFKTKEDITRDSNLKELGYEVLRFQENEVKNRLDYVVAVIENKISDFE